MNWWATWRQQRRPLAARQVAGHFCGPLKAFWPPPAVVTRSAASAEPTRLVPRACCVLQSRRAAALFGPAVTEGREDQYLPRKANELSCKLNCQVATDNYFFADSSANLCQFSLMDSVTVS